MERKWCFNCGNSSESEAFCAMCRRHGKASWIPDTEAAKRDLNYVYGKPSVDVTNMYPKDMVILDGMTLSALENSAKRFGCRVVVESWFRSVNMPGIEKVIFNDPATIIIWDDGTKTVVKAQNGELFDPEKGLAMAVSKKALGNKGNYFDEFKKWLPEEKKEPTDIQKVVEEMKDPMWDLTVAPDESWKDALIEYLRNFEK